MQALVIGGTKGRGRYPRPAHGDARSDSRSRSPPPAHRGRRGAARDPRCARIGWPEPAARDEVPPEVAPAVVAVLVTSDPGPWLEDALACLAAPGVPGALGARARQRLDRGPDAAHRGRDAAGVRAPARRPTSGSRRPRTTRCARSRARRSCCSATTTSCSDPTRSASWSRRRTGRTPASSGRSSSTTTTPRCCSRSGWPSTTTACRSPASSPARSTRSSTTRSATSSSCRTPSMLVRADLFHELGGFDPATFPGSDDLDLCWRARLAGARVLVAPDARVRHRRADGAGRRGRRAATTTAT